MTSRNQVMLKALSRDELDLYVEQNVQSLSEGEVLGVLENPYCTAAICQAIARNSRLTGYYNVRLRLVAHRKTPHAHSAKLIHYLYWPDLVRLSVDVTVAAPVRRAIDTQLLIRFAKLSLGEKVATARRCSDALIKVLLFEADPRILASLLVNQRLSEEHLVMLLNSSQVTSEHIQIMAGDRKWSSRYAIRKALVLSVRTPRATAASQLRFLTRRDRREIYANPGTSVYLRRCIERMGDGPKPSETRVE